jgi:hypothetical protein
MPLGTIGKPKKRYDRKTLKEGKLNPKRETIIGNDIRKLIPLVIIRAIMTPCKP